MKRLTRRNVQLMFDQKAYTESNYQSIPFKQGLYIAFSAIDEGDKYRLNRLLYIGMGDDTPVADRIKDHIDKQHGYWRLSLRDNEKIVYIVAPYSRPDIHDVECAMIVWHQPVWNIRDRQKYNGNRPAPDVIYMNINLANVNGYAVDRYYMPPIRPFSRSKN